MGSISRLDAAATAQAGLRHFARLTNLVIASTPVGLTGSGQLAEALSRILSGIGAHVRPVADRVPAEVELLILTGGIAVAPEQIDRGDRPLIILDLDDVLDRRRWDQLPLVAARAGISGRQAARDVFLLDPLPADDEPEAA